MVYNGKEIPFPAQVSLSFFKLIEHLEIQAQDTTDEHKAAYAKGLLQEVAQYPELREGITDLSRLKDYQDPIRKLASPLFADALTTNEIKLLSPLFDFRPLVTTKRLDAIVEASGKPLQVIMQGVSEEELYIHCCYFILSSYYQFATAAGPSQFFEVIDQNTGLLHTYKMLINADLCEFEPTVRAKSITEDDYKQLIDNFDDLALWRTFFPPDSWILRGVGIVNLVDVTKDQSLSGITSHLLVKTSDTFEKIQWEIRKLLQDATVSLGAMTLEHGHLLSMEKKDTPSILVPQGESMDCHTELCAQTRDTLIHGKEPLIVTDVEVFHQRVNNGISLRLYQSGLKSYLAVPLLYEGEFLGYIELGSPKAYALNQGTLYQLEGVLPILSMAYKRSINEAQNAIEAIIQQECTTIHPSVKWKFEEEAKKFMYQSFNGEQPTFHDIVFPDLYPLYGQLDIKGSSERRNQAVRKDLMRQLQAVCQVLEVAQNCQPMLVIDELIYRTKSFTAELEHDLDAGSEHRIMDFLRADVYPTFEHLSESNPELTEPIKAYWSMLDKELGTVYEARKAYDSSVNQMNQYLAAFLDSKQAEAQEIFPHYFERYKTDGVEFNMYIGQSITRDRTFHPLFLRNLRLWQLMVMCQMENEFRRLQHKLAFPLEIASLILVYSTPIAVHFRMDEKQFDVEGAYNARYEIIKKRVDKAYIKGTQERITRPGSLVIVYAQEQDAQEYRTYLEYLSGIGKIQKKYEDLPLEDLQGVHGLRALRAEIVYQQTGSKLKEVALAERV